jgi:DNA-binding NtrC family response regulator
MPDLRTVLIIDDDPDIRLTLGAYLEDSGYAILEAADGREGIEIFVSCKPDIVVTDLRMPKLDGFGVITAIKAQHPETPVIAITGTGDSLAVKESVRLGAWDCLLKPISDLRSLETAIKQALERKSTHDE